jgi:hypothetical protein
LNSVAKLIFIVVHFDGEKKFQFKNFVVVLIFHFTSNVQNFKWMSAKFNDECQWCKFALQSMLLMMIMMMMMMMVAVVNDSTRIDCASMLKTNEFQTRLVYLN